MSKFKVGPAKLRDGSEAFIFEVSDKIYFKIKRGDEFGCASRPLNGSYFKSNATDDFDLMPNVEPYRFVQTLKPPVWAMYGHRASYNLEIPAPLVGKTVTITYEEVLE